MRKPPGALASATGLGSIVLFALACALIAPPAALAPAPSPTALVRPSPTLAEAASPSPVPTVQPTPTLTDAQSTLAQLAVDPPASDPVDLARRLRGMGPVPTAVAATAGPIPLGTRRTFSITRTDTAEHGQIEAVLRAESPHVYFWVQSGVTVDEPGLRELLERFETGIYPTTRERFGSEWTPGVDGDPHLHILYASGLGSSVAGYYLSSDEYPVAVYPYSNEREMFYLNADTVSLGSEAIGGILAHEFQHMIHWARDRNESAWVNEGLSELAAQLNGFGNSGRGHLYLSHPDLQLNTWPPMGVQSAEHYGASFLFFSYFLQRVGEEAVRALVAEPANGLAGVDATLAGLGGGVTADDLFADWAVANYVNDPRVDAGRYHSAALDPGAVVSVGDVVSECPAESRTATVSQYGVDYIRVTCPGPFTFRFQGSTEVAVVPTQFPDGRYAFWSNRGDGSDMTLTREFDFSSAAAPLALVYSAWYDIEDSYDYAYVEASIDGGAHWTVLRTTSGTDSDPVGHNYGWGYTGVSGDGPVPGWVTETVDLDAYAGRSGVLIRFEHITDSAVHRPGLLVDDVRVPALGYREGFEDGDGGWRADGFVRLANVLPQTFRVQAIERGPGAVRVSPVTLDSSNAGDYTLVAGADAGGVILVISGTTRVTEELAIYEYSVSSP